MSVGEIERLAEMLAAAHRHVTDALRGMSDEQMHTPPAEGEWSAAEICAHVCESHVMRMHKIARIVEQPDVGRTPEDVERRLATVAEHAGDDLETVLDRLRNAGDEALAVLRGLGAAQLDAKDSTGLEGREIVEQGVVGHVEEHARQLAELRRAIAFWPPGYSAQTSRNRRIQFPPSNLATSSSE